MAIVQPLQITYLCCLNVHHRLEKGEFQELHLREMAASSVSLCCCVILD